MTAENEMFADAIKPVHRVLKIVHVGPRKNRWMVSLIQTITICGDTFNARVTYKIRRDNADGSQQHSLVLTHGTDVNQATDSFQQEIALLKEALSVVRG